MAENTSSSPLIVPINTLKPAEVEELRTLHTLLHLLFHRNKNQHRRSHWWRHFAGFRREVGRLLREVDGLGLGVGGAGDGGVMKKKPKLSGPERMEGERRVQERLGAWRDGRVEGWWLAFTQLTASTQFSALGLVLLATLARVARLVGVTASYEEMAHEEVRRVLDEFAAREGAEIFGAPAVVEAAGGSSGAGGSVAARAGTGEDLGEVVGRNGGGEGGQGGESVDSERAVERGTHEKASAVVAPVGRTTAVASAPPPKKKKRKRGNAIDDLFSGIL